MVAISWQHAIRFLQQSFFFKIWVMYNKLYFFVTAQECAKVIQRSYEYALVCLPKECNVQTLCWILLSVSWGFQHSFQCFTLHCNFSFTAHHSSNHLGEQLRKERQYVVKNGHKDIHIRVWSKVILINPVFKVMVRSLLGSKVRT